MEILYALPVLLLVTILCATVAMGAGQPALIGGVLVGLGVMLLPNSETAIADVGSDETFTAILDLAVFFLMLVAGLEMRPGKLAKAAWTAVPVAVVGMVLPLVLGFLLGWFWLPASDWKVVQSLFLGVALAITAVSVAVKVLMDLGRLESRVGQVVVAAAVLDDIFSLVMLAVLAKLLGMHFLIGAFAAGVLFTRNTISADVYTRLRSQFEVLTRGFFAQPVPTPDVVSYLFSAVVIMAIVTTQMSPLMMRAALAPGDSQSC